MKPLLTFWKLKPNGFSGYGDSDWRELIVVNTRVIGRIGVLATGLGIGAAIVAMPGIASADSSSDWWSPLDVGGLALPAPSADLDLAISFNGVSLVHDGTASATTTTGDFDLAIAYGDDATATATGGFLNVASASGTGSSAIAGFADFHPGSFDYASAVGTNSQAIAGAGNFDTASYFDPETGANEGFAEAVLGNGNSASVFGMDDGVIAGGTADTGAVDVIPGNNDIAEIFGNGDMANAGANLATPGDFDLAAVFGNDLGTAGATGANYLVDILPLLASG